MLKTQTYDIIFEAAEDLYNPSKTQILLLNHCSKTINIAKPRTFQSYCYEFCGLIGVSYSTVRFLIGGRDFNPEACIMSSTLVKVLHNTEFNLQPPNSLKMSFVSLLETSAFSDVVLRFNKEEVRAHKCILASRSAKFEAMFSSNLIESKSSVVNIDCAHPELFKLMLHWVYCGEIAFPDDVFELFDLMLLSDEYLIADLKEKCEEDIIAKLDETNVLKILLLAEKHPWINDTIVDKCKTVFIEDFDRVYKNNPDLEQEITSVPGLMTKLFSHIHAKKHAKRKVTFVFEN